MSENEDKNIESIFRESFEGSPIIPPPTEQEKLENKENAKLKAELNIFTKTINHFGDLIFEKKQEYEVKRLDDKVNSIMSKKDQKEVLPAIKLWHNHNIVKIALPFAAIFILVFNFMIFTGPGIKPNNWDNFIVHYNLEDIGQNAVKPLYMNSKYFPSPQQTSNKQNSESIYFMSPGGNMHTVSPSIILSGTEGVERYIKISGKDINPFIFKTNANDNDWIEVKAPKLKRGEKYSIQVSFEKESAIKWEEIPKQDFMILPSKQAKYVEKMLSGCKTEYEKAKVYYDCYCYAEASKYCLEDIKLNSKPDKTYELLKQCYENMGINSSSKDAEKYTSTH